MSKGASWLELFTFISARNKYPASKYWGKKRKETVRSMDTHPPAVSLSDRPPIFVGADTMDGELYNW